MACRRSIVTTSVIAGAAFSLLSSGCGGGGSPGIASVTTSTSTTTATTATTPSGPATADQSSGSPRTGARFQLAMNVGNATDGAKFSACMRKHGVTNFPDPDSKGVIQFGSGMGIDPNSPTFKTARSDCQKLLPNGGQPTPAQQAAQQQQLLAFSICMRAHGLKDFPDPSGGGLRIRLDPNSPTFQRAQQACQQYLPFKGAQATTKAGGGK
jgi:hypothetical protein